jgi:hypothetical protein
MKLLHGLFHIGYLTAMFLVSIFKSNNNPEPTTWGKLSTEEQLKMFNCPYFSKEPVLKCAVNPSIPCLECSERNYYNETA